MKENYTLAAASKGGGSNLAQSSKVQQQAADKKLCVQQPKWDTVQGTWIVRRSVLVPDPYSE